MLNYSVAELRIRKAIEPIKPCSTPKSYLHGIIQSVIGAFVFMTLVCGLLFILKFSDTQYTFTFGGNGSAKIEKVNTEAKPDTIHSKQY